MRDVQDLELAYQVACNAERFSRGPMYRRPEAPRTSAPNQPSRLSQMRPNQPNPSIPWTHKDDRGKAPVAQKNPNLDAYFKCHQVGHYADNCPSRALYTKELVENETEPIEPLEDYVEEVYQAEDNLAKEYEGDEKLDPDLWG